MLHNRNKLYDNVKNNQVIKVAYKGNQHMHHKKGNAHLKVAVLEQKREKTYIILIIQSSNFYDLANLC